jgi:hypothetical protein
MTLNWKSAAIRNLLKFGIVAALLGWMISSGKLSFSQLMLVLRRPDAVLASVVVWVMGPVLLGTARWWLLMRGAGISCDYVRALKLQMIGFFFNTAMPGAVGGDIVKAIYIVRDQQGASRKTPAMLSVILDRIVGLIGLFAMGVVAALMYLKQLSGNPMTADLIRGLSFVVVCSVVFLGVVFVPYKNDRDPVARLLKLKLPFFGVLSGVYSALRNYRDKPGVVFAAIGISIVVQMIFLWFMGFIGRIMYGPALFDAALLAPIFPFGILVTAIPLAPGGFGVGHAAFDKLFSLVGLPGGANVFNVYALSQLILNLLGILPYLSMKSKIQVETVSKGAFATDR